MAFVDVAVVAGFVVAYGLVSGRLAGTPVTAPMVFVGFGILTGPAALGIVDVNIDSGVIRLLAEGTLLLLLFTDAIRIDLSRLRAEYRIPARLLGIGMPLTIITGAGLAMVVLPGTGLWAAVMVAAILAPTDAALGQAVVADRRIPNRIRQALNVESGLNDGLAVPVVTIALALTGTALAASATSEWVAFVLRQLGFGVMVGILVGAIGGVMIDKASRSGWIDGTFRQLATLAVGVGAFAFAGAIDGNGFIAAFVAGIAFGVVAREQCPNVYDFAEDEGQLLSLLTFFAFGAAMAGPVLGEVTWRVALYAVAMLTVARMVPVAVALVGLGLQPVTSAFVGWFGPRGLASIVFVLVVVEEGGTVLGSEIYVAVVLTVLLSVYLHGLTAAPIAGRYGRRVEAMAADHAAMEENLPAPELRLRIPAGEA